MAIEQSCKALTQVPQTLRYTKHSLNCHEMNRPESTKSKGKTKSDYNTQNDSASL